MQKVPQNSIEHAFAVGASDVASYWQQVAVARFSGLRNVLSEVEVIRIQKALTRMRNGFLAARAADSSAGSDVDSGAVSSDKEQQVAQQQFLSILGVKDVV